MTVPTGAEPATLAGLLAFDREHVWHPYTSITGADGVRLMLAGGSQVIDGMSPWWSAIQGHRVPELDARPAPQSRSMSHVMFGGLTHAPAIELAERLVAITPGTAPARLPRGLGSVSVEVAIKMDLRAVGEGDPA